MRLTRFTDLALRAVMWLATSAEDQLPTTREVADAMRVPYAHMTKAVARLQHLGVIETRRGRGGGLALSPRGRSVSVGWLVRELEGMGDVTDCDGTIPCPLREPCRLRAALRQAQEAFYTALDPLAVADLVAAPAGPVLLGLIPRPESVR